MLLLLLQLFVRFAGDNSHFETASCRFSRYRTMKRRDYFMGIPNRARLTMSIMIIRLFFALTENPCQREIVEIRDYLDLCYGHIDLDCDELDDWIKPQTSTEIYSDNVTNIPIAWTGILFAGQPEVRIPAGRDSDRLLRRPLFASGSLVLSPGCRSIR
jgi:hypothetical protein